MGYLDRRDISVLIGKTLTEVRQYNDEAIYFTTSTGEKYIMHHQQDCCEIVSIESIVGDLNDLVGEPILAAEEISSDGTPPLDENDERWGTYTWTFYKFATRKGYVDIRWYGSSNGYYSEAVDFEEL